MKTCTLLTWQLENRLLKPSGWYLTNCCAVFRVWTTVGVGFMQKRLLEVKASVKLGRCDSCGLPFSAPERISEQALSCSLEERALLFLRQASLRWPEIAMMCRDGSCASDHRVICSRPDTMVWIALLSPLPVWWPPEVCCLIYHTCWGTETTLGSEDLFSGGISKSWLFDVEYTLASFSKLATCNVVVDSPRVSGY